MKDINKLKVGDMVTYIPKMEKGIIKTIKENGVWVVYNCNNEWHRIKDYTAAKTNIKDLKKGWY